MVSSTGLAGRIISLGSRNFDGAQSRVSDVFPNRPSVWRGTHNPHKVNAGSLHYGNKIAFLDSLVCY